MNDKITKFINFSFYINQNINLLFISSKLKYVFLTRLVSFSGIFEIDNIEL